MQSMKHCQCRTYAHVPAIRRFGVTQLAGQRPFLSRLYEESDLGLEFFEWKLAFAVHSFMSRLTYSLAGACL